MVGLSKMESDQMRAVRVRVLERREWQEVMWPPAWRFLFEWHWRGEEIKERLPLWQLAV